MVISFPCSIGAKSIGDDVFCDKCNSWIHIKCNNLNYVNYEYLNDNDDPWFCLKCNSEIFPLGTLNNKTFNLYIDDSNVQNKDYDKDYSCNLVLDKHAPLKKT